MPADTTLEKPLPNNLDAERSVLGAILLDNHALNPAIEHLRPEDFFLDQHRRVFTQMIALGESQQAIDLVTLTEEMHRKGDLEASSSALSRARTGPTRFWITRNLRFSRWQKTACAWYCCRSRTSSATILNAWKKSSVKAKASRESPRATQSLTS